MIDNFINILLENLKNDGLIVDIYSKYYDPNLNANGGSGQRKIFTLYNNKVNNYQDIIELLEGYGSPRLTETVPVIDFVHQEYTSLGDFKYNESFGKLDETSIEPIVKGNSSSLDLLKSKDESLINRALNGESVSLHFYNTNGISPELSDVLVSKFDDSNYEYVYRGVLNEESNMFISANDDNEEKKGTEISLNESSMHIAVITERTNILINSDGVLKENTKNINGINVLDSSVTRFGIPVFDTITYTPTNSIVRFSNLKDIKDFENIQLTGSGISLERGDIVFVISPTSWSASYYKVILFLKNIDYTEKDESGNDIVKQKSDYTPYILGCYDTSNIGDYQKEIKVGDTLINNIVSIHEVKKTLDKFIKIDIRYKSMYSGLLNGYFSEPVLKNNTSFLPEVVNSDWIEALEDSDISISSVNTESILGNNEEINADYWYFYSDGEDYINGKKINKGHLLNRGYFSSKPLDINFVTVYNTIYNEYKNFLDNYSKSNTFFEENSNIRSINSIMDRSESSVWKNSPKISSHKTVEETISSIVRNNGMNVFNDDFSTMELVMPNSKNDSGYNISYYCSDIVSKTRMDIITDTKVIDQTSNASDAKNNISVVLKRRYYRHNGTLFNSKVYFGGFRDGITVSVTSPYDLYCPSKDKDVILTYFRTDNNNNENKMYFPKGLYLISRVDLDFNEKDAISFVTSNNNMTSFEVEYVYKFLPSRVKTIYLVMDESKSNWSRADEGEDKCTGRYKFIVDNFNNYDNLEDERAYLKYGTDCYIYSLNPITITTDSLLDKLEEQVSNVDFSTINEFKLSIFPFSYPSEFLSCEIKKDGNKFIGGHANDLNDLNGAYIIKNLPSNTELSSLPSNLSVLSKFIDFYKNNIANKIIRVFVDKIVFDYPITIVDNEKQEPIRVRDIPEYVSNLKDTYEVMTSMVGSIEVQDSLEDGTSITRYLKTDDIIGIKKRLDLSTDSFKITAKVREEDSDNLQGIVTLELEKSGVYKGLTSISNSIKSILIGDVSEDSMRELDNIFGENYEPLLRYTESVEELAVESQYKYGNSNEKYYLDEYLNKAIYEKFIIPEFNDSSEYLSSIPIGFIESKSEKKTEELIGKDNKKYVVYTTVYDIYPYVSTRNGEASYRGKIGNKLIGNINVYDNAKKEDIEAISNTGESIDILDIDNSDSLVKSIKIKKEENSNNKEIVATVHNAYYKNSTNNGQSIMYKENDVKTVECLEYLEDLERILIYKDIPHPSDEIDKIKNFRWCKSILGGYYFRRVLKLRYHSYNMYTNASVCKINVSETLGNNPSYLEETNDKLTLDITLSSTKDLSNIRDIDERLFYNLLDKSKEYLSGSSKENVVTHLPNISSKEIEGDESSLYYNRYISLNNRMNTTKGNLWLASVMSRNIGNMNKLKEYDLMKKEGYSNIIESIPIYRMEELYYLPASSKETSFVDYDSKLYFKKEMDAIARRIKDQCILTCTRCNVKDNCLFYDEEGIIRKICSPADYIRFYVKDNELDLICHDEDNEIRLSYTDENLPESQRVTEILPISKDIHNSWNRIDNVKITNEDEIIYESRNIYDLENKLKNLGTPYINDISKKGMGWISGFRYGTLNYNPLTLKDSDGQYVVYNPEYNSELLHKYQYLYNAIFVEDEESEVIYKESDNAYPVSVDIGPAGNKKSYKGNIHIKIPTELKLFMTSSPDDDVYIASDDEYDENGNKIYALVYINKIKNIIKAFDLRENEHSATEHATVSGSNELYPADVAQWCANYYKGACIDYPGGELSDIHNNMDQYWMDTVYWKDYVDEENTTSGSVKVQKELSHEGRPRVQGTQSAILSSIEAVNEYDVISGKPMLASSINFVRGIFIKMTQDDKGNTGCVKWVNDNYLTEDGSKLDVESQKYAFTQMKKNLRLIVVHNG